MLIHSMAIPSPLMRGMVNRLSGAGRPTQEMMPEKNGRLLVETRSNQKELGKTFTHKKG
jgi:hypothetical protein